jgi:hypothetical protein
VCARFFFTAVQGVEACVQQESGSPFWWVMHAEGGTHASVERANNEGIDVLVDE